MNLAFKIKTYVANIFYDLVGSVVDTTGRQVYLYNREKADEIHDHVEQCTAGDIVISRMSVAVNEEIDRNSSLEYAVAKSFAAPGHVLCKVSDTVLNNNPNFEIGLSYLDTPGFGLALTTGETVESFIKEEASARYIRTASLESQINSEVFFSINSFFDAQTHGEVQKLLDAQMLINVRINIFLGVKQAVFKVIMPVSSTVSSFCFFEMHKRLCPG